MEVNNLSDLELYFRKEKMFDLLNVNRIGVFGSFARNEFFNDIDLMIEDDIKTESLISFHEKLTKDLPVPVDIVLSKYAEPIILYRAKQDLKYAERE